MNQFENKNYKFDRTVRTGNYFGLPIRKTVRFGPEVKSKIWKIIAGLFIAWLVYFFVSGYTEDMDKIEKLETEIFKVRT